MDFLSYIMGKKHGGSEGGGESGGSASNNNAVMVSYRKADKDNYEYVEGMGYIISELSLSVEDVDDGLVVFVGSDSTSAERIDKTKNVDIQETDAGVIGFIIGTYFMVITETAVSLGLFPKACIVAIWDTADSMDTNPAIDELRLYLQPK